MAFLSSSSLPTRGTVPSVRHRFNRIFAALKIAGTQRSNRHDLYRLLVLSLNDARDTLPARQISKGFGNDKLGALP